MTPPGLPEGQLYRPAKAGPYPAVLLIHGGGWRSGGPRTWHRSARPSPRLAWPSRPPVLSPDHQHPAQEADVREALRWLAAREDVDSDRLALWGYSAGAQLALKTAFTTHSPSSAPWSPAAPRGISPSLTRKARSCASFWASRDSSRALGRSLAPEFWRAGAAPTFIYHGAEDRLVIPRHAERVHEALKAAGVESQLRTVPGGHMGVFILNRDIEREAIAFLQQQVRP